MPVLYSNLLPIGEAPAGRKRSFLRSPVTTGSSRMQAWFSVRMASFTARPQGVDLPCGLRVRGATKRRHPSDLDVGIPGLENWDGRPSYK